MPTSSIGIPALQRRGGNWSRATSVRVVLGRTETASRRCAARAMLGYSFYLLAASAQKQQRWKMQLKPGLPITKYRAHVKSTLASPRRA